MVRNEIIVLLVVCGTVFGAVGGVVQPTAGERLDSTTGAERVASTHATALQDSDSYVVEQGSFCRQVEPISSGETIESYYDYRSHDTHPEGADRNYSSYGTRGIQEDDTSTLFLHEGPEGLSIGVVHGHLRGDSGGGLATFEFVGLPAESEWVVQDDRYEGDSNMDEWSRDATTAAASWIWESNRTDGGAIRGGLDGAFAVTVYPAFNDEAEFADDPTLYDPDFHEDGAVEDLDVVSGGPGSPDREELPSMSEPITIRTGTCDDPSVWFDRTDDGLGVSVTDADAGDRIPFRPPYETDDGVRFERVDVTSSGEDLTFGFADGSSVETPDDLRTLGQLAVTGDPSDASASVTFTVDRDRLAERGLEPDDVAVYERDGETWRESPTTLEDEPNESYRFSANVTSFGSLVVAPSQPLEMSGVNVNRSTITEGEAVQVTVSVQNPHYATKSYAANFTVFGEQVDSQTVTVAGGETGRITFEQEFIAQGTYTLEVNGVQLEVVVEPAEDDDGNETGDDSGRDGTNDGVGDDGTTDGDDGGNPATSPMPGFGFAAGFGALLALVGLRVARARER